ncbi:hypothetical protein DPMN_190280 [Dreissena polymorpha]|uniref:Uncharacterized protein n=1 Tax=Dreissena polymorpha TaxID=45954 RepID=A0A9D4DTJ3_DREPO|nr:hypothetical protein DPMN_190280 [Dreissena polymorpha]
MFSYRVTVLCANTRQIQQMSRWYRVPPVSSTNTYLRQRRQLIADEYRKTMEQLWKAKLRTYRPYGINGQE